MKILSCCVLDLVVDNYKTKTIMWNGISKASFVTIASFINVAFVMGQSSAREVDTLRFLSKSINDSVTAYVSKPANYHSSGKRYAVLFHIGSTQILTATSDYLNTAAQDIPPMILVSVAVRNSTFFMPFETGNARYDTARSRGKAELFVEMVERELFVKLKEKYRLADFNVLAAHSFLAAFELFLFSKKSNLFQGIVASSPALLNMPTVTTKHIPYMLREGLDKTHYLYFTVAENDYPGFLQQAAMLKDSLASLANENLKWKFDYMKELDHGNIAPATFFNGLLFIFRHKELEYLR